MSAGEIVRRGSARWKPDSQRTSCASCGSTFHLARRRHHCRACGDIFCSGCVQRNRAQNLVCRACSTAARQEDAQLREAMRLSLASASAVASAAAAAAPPLPRPTAPPLSQPPPVVPLGSTDGEYMTAGVTANTVHADEAAALRAALEQSLEESMGAVPAPPAPPATATATPTATPTPVMLSSTHAVADAADMSDGGEDLDAAIALSLASRPDADFASASRASRAVAPALAMTGAAASTATGASTTASVPRPKLVRSATEEQVELAIQQSLADAQLAAPHGVASATPRLIEPCTICFVDEGDAFVPDGCIHIICRDCALQYVRNALSDRAGAVFPEGLRCPQHSSGCSSFITLDDCAALLPGDDAGDASAEGATGGALLRKEYETLARHIVEAAIPDAQKLFCPKCEVVTLIDAADSGGSGGGGRVAPLPQGLQRCPHCDHTWEPATVAGEDAATSAFLDATSKPCPSCGQRTTHYHGHECHHIGAGTGGCPSCKQHWCYVCGRKHGEPGGRCTFHPDCEHHQTFCTGTNIKRHLAQLPYPHDTRCGCPICPNCRPRRPCAQCTGHCVVCRGLVPPGPTSLVETAAATT